MILFCHDMLIEIKTDKNKIDKEIVNDFNEIDHYVQCTYFKRC